MNLVVAELLRRHPQAAQVLRDEGLASCLGCVMAPFETVAEAARELGVDPARVARALVPFTQPGAPRAALRPRRSTSR